MDRYSIGRRIKEKSVLIVMLIQLVLVIRIQAQQSNVKELVDSFCECSEKTNTEIELKNCLEILRPLDKIYLSKEDSLYIIKAVKGKCGKSKKNQCNFLQESDLEIYNLRKVKQMMNSVEWESKSTSDGRIISLHDSREKYVTESEAELNLKKQKERIFSGFTKLSLEGSEHGHAEVYFLESLMDTESYIIFVREKELTGYILVTLRTGNSSLVKELLEKMESRMKEVCN